MHDSNEGTYMSEEPEAADGARLAALDDAALARALADAAGRTLLSLRGGWTGDPAQLRDRGDRESHELLMRLLAESRPDDAVLSEEGADDRARLDAERVWIVDPLDGTREFGEVPREDWAVHVALWSGGELVAGAVARPAMGSTLATDELPAVPAPHEGPLRLAVSRSRPPQFVQDLAELLDGTLVPMGSAGVKATAVLDGTVDAYVHAGGQYEWDSAAPVAVCRAAGLHTSRIDGSPLTYNHEDPTLPDLVICRTEVAQRVLEGIGTLTRKGSPS